MKSAKVAIAALIGVVAGIALANLPRQGVSLANFTDTPPVFDTKGESLTWKAGCESGLVLDCYCKIAPQQEGSVYSVLQRVRLTVGNDGRIESAELLPDRVRIKADCKRMNPAKL
ncbi:MAG: hypothetical protein II823_07305 [Kiritimatiellae bacterium]|nr:hypothetical protein [Kiritimatiellia bacterium]